MMHNIVNQHKMHKNKSNGKIDESLNMGKQKWIIAAIKSGKNNDMKAELASESAYQKTCYSPKMYRGLANHTQFKNILAETLLGSSLSREETQKELNQLVDVFHDLNRSTC
jgi:hypothetical protein